MTFKILFYIIVMTLSSGTQAKPVTEKQMPSCPDSPNCVSSQADADKDAGHYIAPIRITGSTPGVWAALKSLLQSMPRVSLVSEKENYLYAEFASSTMGFVDDVEFVLDEKAGVIHVRSASRLGRSDFGVNRDRIETIRSRIAAAMK